MRYIQRSIQPIAALRAKPDCMPQPALILRALVLLLIVLLLTFVGLMHATGSYDVGGPVLGSVLLIGLGAAHCAR
jgi:hypothetical protein